MPDRKTAISNLDASIRWIEDIPCHQFPGWLNVTISMRNALELLKEQETQHDYEASVEMAEYCERYEQTYNPEDGSM